MAHSLSGPIKRALKQPITWVATFVVLLLVLLATPVFWQPRWIEEPAVPVSFQTKLPQIDERALSTDSPYSQFKVVESGLLKWWSLLGRSSQNEWNKEADQIFVIPWSNAEFPLTAKSLVELEPLIQQARAVARREDAVVPTDTKMECGDFLRAIRLARQLLSASASKNAADQNFEAMRSDVSDAIRLDLFSMRGGHAWHTIVGCVGIIATTENLVHLSKRYELPAKLSEGLIAELDSWDKQLPEPAEVLRYELPVSRTKVSRFYDGITAGSLGPHSRFPDWSLPLLAMGGSTPPESQRDIKWYLEHLIILAEKGDTGAGAKLFSERIAEKVHFGDYLGFATRDVVGALLTLDAHHLSNAVELIYYARSSLRGTSVLLAAACARERTGALPSLDVLPGDPFCRGSKMRIKVGEEGLVVYSTGPDGKDDGGFLKKRPYRTMNLPQDSGEDYVIGRIYSKTEE